ncbi:DUF4158 domain-containing protein [Streptomyces goshikiensis]|uniref:DUF4158 domain-containing protein n=1 Tax=Streptomyces goshikiensis TaxID=1942 RepID=UPI003659ABC2
MSLDLDELVERWMLLKDERDLVSGKRDATRLGFAVPLTFSTQYGRYLRGWVELSGEDVEFVARQVRAPASELGMYEWTGQADEHRRAQVRGQSRTADPEQSAVDR